MERVFERCCGLDVHKDTVVACLRLPGQGRRRRAEVRTFGTTTGELLALADWLQANQCDHVAMESTGVYWKPVFNLLESVCEVCLVNARHIKTVPGRKTDVRDCEWIAELLEHGLLRASFIPPEPIRELRDVTRYRKTLIQQRSMEANRLQKLLETANIKLGSVASDILGVSGRAMLEALIAGERDAAVLARLARGRMRKKRDALAAALSGRFTEHHAFLTQQILSLIDELNEHIRRCDERVAEYLRHYALELDLLLTIPVVGQRTAEVIIAEIGTDMSPFPSAGHLASWAALCPGNNESAGKRGSGRTRMGNRWLRAALIEVAWGAARLKGTYLSSLYSRLARRRGARKAIVAVAHNLLVATWHILKRRVPYQDLGAEHFDRLHTQRLVRHYKRRLEELGHQVILTPAPKAAANGLTASLSG